MENMFYNRTSQQRLRYGNTFRLCEVLDRDINEVSEVKYFCACNRRLQVYQHKSAAGQSFETKNLIDQKKLCTGSEFSHSQLQLSQCFMNKTHMSKADTSFLK